MTHSPGSADAVARPARTLVGLLPKLADLVMRHRGATLAVWLVIPLGTVAAQGAAGSHYKADYTATGSDSQAAEKLLVQRFPAEAGQSLTVIVRMLLVPAIMRLLGRYAWWLPGFLGRLIPKIALEEAEERASDLSSTPA